MGKINKVLVAFLFLNLILYLGQQLFHLKDNRRISEIEATLPVLATIVTKSQESYDEEVDELGEMKKRIEYLDEELNRLLKMYPNGAPSFIVSSFNALKDEYNELVLNYKFKNYNLLLNHASYLSLFNEYQQLVNEYNLLIQKTKIFLLIPIPNLRWKLSN